MTRHPRVGLAFLCGLVAAIVRAEEPTTSLEELHGRAATNWPAPLFWSPGSTRSSTADLLEKSVISAVTAPLPFIGITPCRLVDTRVASFPPGFGPPSLVGGAARTFTLPGQCGLPIEAAAYSLNFTVLPPANPPFSYLSAYPTGGSPPAVSTLNWGTGGASAVYFNAAIVPAGSGGGIDVFASSGTNLIIDVNGYYTNNLTSEGGVFTFTSDNAGQGGVLLVTNAETAAGTGAIQGVSGCSGCGIGYSLQYGVLGASLASVSSGGGIETVGFLGTNSYGVFSYGDYGGTGAKYFVEPHPQDASKIIRYVALEGPEAGTYFRGTSETHGGTAVIDVPETFRLVTEQVGLTVQLTPIGELAILAVVSKGLDRIVVQSSKDIRFDYQVNGVRHGYAGFDPVSTSLVFAPAAADEKMPAYLTEAEKRALIANGTYNADGSVNLATAKVQGWDRAWPAPPR